MSTAAKRAVTIIPARVNMAHNDATVSTLRRVAAYARVSTDDEEQLTSYDAQVAKMRGRGMDPGEFAFYLTLHKHGVPPHGGMGIGLERMTARLLGLDNIRRATLFPRDTKRLTP